MADKSKGTQWELGEEEIARQAGRAVTNHPYEEGRQAGRAGCTEQSCPYVKGNQKRTRWLEGLKKGAAEHEQVGAQEGPAMATPAAGKGGAKRSRKKPPPKDAQKELIKGARTPAKKEGKIVELPEEVSELLEPLDDAIYFAATYKDQENKYKDRLLELMGETKLSEVTLPRGGKILFTPGHATLKYIPPKDAKKVTAAGGE